MKVHFAVIADKNIEVGLHTTIYSALKNLNSESKAVVHLFLKNYSDLDLQAIRLTIKEFSEKCELKIYDAGKIDLGTGKALHGNKMPYVLFKVPDLVEAETVICLDADLLIITDLFTLFNTDLEENAVGVVGSVTLKFAMLKEKLFLNSVGVSDYSIYFNTGVLLVDTAKWRKQNLTNKCLEFAASYPQQLYTADQTVLNAVLTNCVTFIPEKYNIHCYPQSPAINLDQADGIYHFVGSPKPWDLMGEFLHNSYPAFLQYLVRTEFKTFRSYKNVSINKINRTLRIGRSYYRLMKIRFFQNNS